LFPLFYPLVPLMWFVLGAWMLALEYVDYPMDNHHQDLAAVRARLAAEPLTSLGFGAGVMLGTMIPLVQLIIMPAAICGATLYWHERLRQPLPRPCPLSPRRPPSAAGPAPRAARSGGRLPPCPPAPARPWGRCRNWPAARSRSRPFP